MKQLLVTWTDIFLGIGEFFEWTFKIIKALGHFPNVLISITIIGLMAYWSKKIIDFKKESQRNGTLE
ncbi:MAG: hypothetical protein N3F09_04955 [Bacteroidia bacterium]|nr:hypothetical protein [Bacteroidia bacterium]